MTKEEIIEAFKTIIRKCDCIINNKYYTADDYAQDKVEDIAEMCHKILDGQFGEIVENKLPSNLDEAAKKIAYDVCKALPNGEQKDIVVYYAIQAAIAAAEQEAKNINSIQQEQQEVDMEKEIKRYKEHYILVRDKGFSLDWMDIETTARHFYELGQKEMRERIANPQYNQEVIAKMKSEFPTEEFKARKEE